MTEYRIVPVILSGGAGVRLWPWSRANRPKQFIPLFEGKSLFDMTLERVADSDLFDDPVIVSATNSIEHVLTSLAFFGSKGKVLAEPIRRDSGAAVAVATQFIALANPKALILVLAADHLVEDVEAFKQAVRDARSAADDGEIVTFGIKPTSPHIGYGYIQPGSAKQNGLKQIARFIEKPDLEKAKMLMEHGCFWNSGNFLFRADVMAEEILRYEPAMSDTAMQVAIALKATNPADGKVLAIPEAIFSKSPSKSIDYAVLERTSKGVVKDVSYTWSDLGTWSSIWEAFDKDENGNVVIGRVQLFSTRNSLVISENQQAVVVDQENSTVVITEDVVLVGKLDVSSALKEIVSRLEGK